MKDMKESFRIEPLPVETACDWNPREFTKIRVLNPEVSYFGDDQKNGTITLPISYDLVPMVQGIARHKDKGFTMHDFWITRHDAPVKQFISLADYFDNLERRRLNPSSVGNTNVVLWHQSSLLHIPRGEDGNMPKSASENGQALATWSIVELRPRNVSFKTPIYPPPR
jgi:hypothetical protein